MKFKILKDELLLPLQQISRVATSKVIPILGGVLVMVNSQNIILIGGDSNNFLRYEINKDSFTHVESGSVVLAILTFTEIIKKMDGEMIQVELLDNLSVKIVSGNSKFHLSGKDASEYPEVNMEDEGKQIILHGGDLKELINQTCYAISTKEETSILTGINLMVNNDFIRFTACDRHRLARVTKTLNTGIIENKVISGKALVEIKFLVKDELPVKLNFTNNRVLIKQGTFTYALTPLEGTYPDTERMITKECSTKAVVSTKSLLKSLERTIIISDSGSEFIISMQISNEYLRIYCKSKSGYLDEHIVLQRIDGSPFRVNYNVKYALDAMKTIGTEYTAIQYSLNQQMIIFKPHGKENSLHLLMESMKQEIISKFQGIIC